jgi:Protein of unknown function (DUF3631)
MKAEHPDINDTLRTEGPDAVRARHDKASLIAKAKGGQAVTADSASSEDQKKADDWLTAFAKQSQQALAKRAAEKKITPPPDEKTLVEALARKDHTEYDRLRGDVAETLGVRVGTLDDKVEALRKKMAAAGGALPHWEVEPWSEPVDGTALLESLRQQFARYVVLPTHAAVALALWTLHTWVFQCFDITPYLSITSPTKRCGKTVLMTLLFWLSWRGKKSDSMSKAAIYRSVEGERPTLILDEVSWVLDSKDDRQGILCGGFERNGYVEICEGEGANITTRQFSTFCPKAFGLIGKLTGTLTDRSICVHMRRKLRTDKVERLRRRDNGDFARLRQQCLRWANDNAKALEEAQPEVDDRLNDRALDFWEPLFIIADRIGGSWPQLARQAAYALNGMEDEDGANVEVLRDIRVAFGDDEVIRSADLVAKLAVDPERPWAEWKHGRPLSQKQLGALLRPLGIISETVSVPGFNDAKGYKRARFEEAWAAYCPGQNRSPPDFEPSKRRSVAMPVESAQVGDFGSVAPGSADASKNGKLSHSHAGFDASTDRKAQNSGQGHFDQEPELALGQRCDHCGWPGATGQWDWQGRPNGVWLHSACEAPWFDRETGRPPRDEPRLAADKRTSPG